MAISNSPPNPSHQPSDACVSHAGAGPSEPIQTRLTENDIVGLKYFDQLLSLFERLHDDGCQRDKAGNPLTEADRAANVLSDQIVVLGKSSNVIDRPDTMRLVIDEDQAACLKRQVQRRFVGRRLRRFPANRDKFVRCPRRDHRTSLCVSMDN